MKREKLTRERIINGAFHAWGRTHFADTSLNAVARHLGVTKPAVYRYFRSKEEVMDALREDFARRMLAEVVEPMGGVDPADPQEFLHSYIQHVLQFYVNHPYHYSFLIQVLLLGTALERRQEFRELARRREALLSTVAPDGMARRHIQRIAMYWTTDHLRRDPATGAIDASPVFDPEGRTLGDHRRRAVVEQTTHRLCTGFLPRDHRPVDLAHVERTAWLLPEEMPEADRVFSAIEDVVQEKGYAGATVEHIAERIGITKSSLYHYFRNRDDMLVQMILRDQLHFAGLARVRLHQLEHPEEQLYGLFVMICSYAAQHSTFLTVENWLRQNEVTVEIPEDHIRQIQEIFAFLTEMLMAGMMVGDPGEAFAVIGFIRYAIMQELNELPRPFHRDRCVALVRELYNLFANGLFAREGALAAVATATETLDLSGRTQ